MHNIQITEKLLIEHFLNTLREVPGVDAQLIGQPSSNGRNDAIISVQVAGKAIKLLVEAKKALYPRDARQALWQIKQREIERPSEDEVLFLIAELISPGAKALLREERVGYFEGGGSLFLPAPGAYIFIDKPSSGTLFKSERSLFSGRRSQVLQALLLEHQNWFGVKELAKRAQVSPATASQVFKDLERYDWVVSRGSGPSKERRLTEPGPLLDAWARRLASTRASAVRRYYVPSMGAEKLLERMGQVFEASGAEYAVTHEAAAQRYAPFLSSISQVRCRLLAGRDAEAALGELNAREVSQGANLVVIEAKSPGELLFRAKVGGVWLASPIQVYLDLLRGEGRTKELAEHLRRERMGF